MCGGGGWVGGWVGGGGGGGGLPCIFVVSGRMTMKFCTGANNCSLTSNTKKDFEKSNDMMDNETSVALSKHIKTNTWKMDVPPVLMVEP